MPSINRFPPLCVLLSCLLSCLLWSAAATAPSAGDESSPTDPVPLLEGPVRIATKPLYADGPIEDEAPAPAERPTHDLPPRDLGEPVETPLDDESAEARLTEEQASDEAVEEASDRESSDAELPEVADPAEPEQKPELTAAMVALRDRVRRTLATFHRNALSARENTATELMHACLAFGCVTEVYRSGSSGQKINGIGCLCWNFPCAGFKLLVLAEGGVAARIGYGLQQRDSQLLAVLALSRVQADYTMRVGEEVRTVADLVEYEKLSCRSGTDLSLKLIGLSYYAGDDATWQNSLGEDWSTERIVKEELVRPIVGSANGGTDRLMGLSYAVQRRVRQGRPIDGQFARAKKLVDEFTDYALGIQNRDGSWSPHFFAAVGTSRDRAANLRSTGHILQWLAMALPEDQLDDPRVVRSVEYVNGLLGSSIRSRRNVRSLSTREIGSVMHAVHALAVYDERYFQPRTAPLHDRSTPE